MFPLSLCNPTSCLFRHKIFYPSACWLRQVLLYMTRRCRHILVCQAATLCDSVNKGLTSVYTSEKLYMKSCFYVKGCYMHPNKFKASNGLFVFEKKNLIMSNVCAYKLNNENSFANTVAVIRLHIPKKNNLMLIFTFLKHFLQQNYKFLLKIFIKALLFMWVAIHGTACWTALLLWRQVVWREKRTHCVTIIIIKMAREF